MKGGLTLDSKSGWSEGGTHGPAIIPGDTQKSLLLKMVHWSDEDHRMPPKQKLADDEIAALETWIQSGAPDPRAAIAKAKPTADWWSLNPLTAPAPAPPTPPGPLPANPIDRFIDARLAASNLTPSPPADPRSLVRRLFIDLTGLPPSPEDLQDFLTKSAASPAAAEAAYNELVDRLLASPRHGERWARHWLDTIHFADTHGFEHDVHRPHAWRFRDYVIKAFNSDTPWPRFIQEQLAADAFFPAETNLTAALGFLGAGPFDASAEGTAPAAFEYVDRDDLVTQTMGAFVSTTANCARCHAHKFDPITQEDYFALQAVFAGTGKGNLSYDEDPATAAARTRWTAVLTTASTPGPTQAAQLLTPENEAVLTAWENDGGGRESWDELIPGIYTSAFGSILTKLPDNSILSSGPRPDMEVYTVSLTGKVKDITALRLDLLTDDSLPMKGPGRLDNGNMHLSEFEAQVFRATGAAPEKITFSQAAADFDQAGYAAPAMLDGDPKTSWAIHPSVGVPHHAILKLSAPLTMTGDDRLVVTLKQIQGGQHVLGRFRLSATSAPAGGLVALTAPARAALLTPPNERTPEARLAIAADYLKVRAAQQIAALPPMAVVYASSPANQAARAAKLGAPQPRLIRLLKRGDLDKPGDPVSPGALSTIATLPARFTLTDPNNDSQRRAALASWIADSNNPLTWRSAVNRIWHYHFGKGLCDTPSDFGRMGGAPSHPELLDWLAVWFRDDAKGSLKALHRLIVTSNAWKQSSALPAPRTTLTAPAPNAGDSIPISTFPPVAPPPADPAAIDPDNRLLWHMSRSRMDADSFRDSILSISGRLDLTMGGPGVAHYNASPGPQATPVLDYANFNWDAPGATRRSIYRVVYRGIADPFLEVLDFPDMGMLSPTRGFSASALQSLTLFNNHFLLGQSQHLAERSAQGITDPAESVRRMFSLVLLRAPEPQELTDFTALAQSAGLPAVARVLFNSNEFLFVD